MNGRHKILVVENDSKLIEALTDRLKHLSYEVAVARDGIEALECVANEKPDLILLDILMPRMDGHEVCRRLRSTPATEDILIIMLTAKRELEDKVSGLKGGADDYLTKPFEMAELEVRIEVLLKRRKSPPYTAPTDDSVFSVSCMNAERLGIRTRGITAVMARSRNPLKIDTESFSRKAKNAPQEQWRFYCKDAGKDLFNRIFSDHPEVITNYVQALGEMGGKDDLLHMYLETSRDLIRLPLEFLFDDVSESGDYLVLRHSLSRCITGVRIKREILCPIFFNQLWSERNALKVLLIASNTKPDIPGVDDEIEALASSLKASFEAQGLIVQLTKLTTEQATYEKVRKTIRESRFHIIHYAGHGRYNEQSPEKSSIFFWERENRSGEIKAMRSSEVSILLNGSDVRFVYLSCCQGTVTGGKDVLLDDDFLGLADAIIHAGIPGCLGFRWPVSDIGAKRLAKAFYQSLARQGRVDKALLDARLEVAALDRDDVTWLSPILILQQS